MEQALFAEKLRELALKYAVAADMDVAFEPRAVLVSCELGNFRFYYDFAAAPEKDGRQNAPLMHWRLRRRYMELRNALEQGMVKVPLAMRVHHIVSTDDLTASLEDVLFMEADLFEWICGDEINRVFAAVDGDYMNGILSTAGNVKASMELGLLPASLCFYTRWSPKRESCPTWRWTRRRSNTLCISLPVRKPACIPILITSCTDLASRSATRRAISCGRLPSPNA